MRPKIIQRSNFLISIFCLSLLANIAKSQTDTLFWFAAPDVSNGNGGNPNTDRPIFLRLATYNKPSTITISQPAISSFAPIVINLAANSTQSVNLTTWISQIENYPANTILNYGLKISATENITAYYECQSQTFNNPAMFNLKGKISLGTSFYISSQTSFNNSSGYPDLPENSFDIVATENNTQITITPSVPIIGHSAGIAFNINLNKGQTYSCYAVGLNSADHLAGSFVQSTKPIAITIKDDLVRPFTLPCADLMGDQTIPISSIGTEYICVKGLLDYSPEINNEDYSYLLATEDNTDIYINGILKGTLNKGQTLIDTIKPPSSYVQATKPVYAMQVSGNGCEFGMSILPPLSDCTGSRVVSFIRSSSQNFAMLLLTKAGNETNFATNTSATINSASFSFVPGTSNSWVSSIQTYNTTDIPINTQITVSNSKGRFHLGVINGNASLSGTLFGYFSDYSKLVSTSQNLKICSGDSILLNSTSNATNYIWDNGDTLSYTYADTAGMYILTKTDGSCTAKDTFNINSLTSPAPSNLIDTSICSGNNIFLIGNKGFDSYLWSTGDTSNSIAVNSSGIYWLESKFCNKTYIDTIYILENEELSSLIVPNVFTPNNDGINDQYLIGGINTTPEFYELSIFDRWGLLMFKSNNYREGWNGYYKGKMVNEGVYYYLLKIKSLCNKEGTEKIQKGFISILK